MGHHHERQTEASEEQVITPEELAQLLGISARMALMLPIKQLRLGARTIRFRLRDVYTYFDIDSPTG